MVGVAEWWWMESLRPSRTEAEGERDADIVV